MHGLILASILAVTATPPGETPDLGTDVSCLQLHDLKRAGDLMGTYAATVRGTCITDTCRYAIDQMIMNVASGVVRIEEEMKKNSCE